MAVLKKAAAAAMALLMSQGGMAQMHEGFVDASTAVPGVVIEARYAGQNNFIGAPITGYEAEKVVVSQEVAAALVNVQAELARQGKALKLFDGFRPQRAVDHFMRWIADTADTKMKAEYYPNIAKKDLVPLGYIAERSGHSRGGSVDLTIVERAADGSWQELDMGSPFDLFDVRSHGDSTLVSELGQANRKMLADLMIKHGFRPYAEEWWHFTIDPEPHPDTYFDFPIK